MSKQDLHKDLELMEATIDKDCLIMSFVDKGEMLLYPVKFNKNVYNQDKGEFEYDEEKAVKCENWAQEYFGCTFDEVPEQVGVKKDVYHYDTFNSLWECDIVNKFTEDMVGEIIQVPISAILEDRDGIRIRFDYEEKTYESRMGYSKNMAGKWFTDPVKKKRQRDKFREKFGCTPEQGVEFLPGVQITVEIKLFAANGAVYCEVKKLPKTALAAIKKQVDEADEADIPF